MIQKIKQQLNAPENLPMRIASYLKALLHGGRLLMSAPTPLNRRIIGLVLGNIKPNYSMMSMTRLGNLYQRVLDANQADIEGVIVECGCWNGGGSAMMGAANVDFGKQRDIWVFDSFEGVPPPTELDGTKSQNVYFEGLNKGRMENVSKILQRVGVNKQHIHIIPGWFDNTLMKNQDTVGAIAVLHADADWYESTKVIFEVLYAQVSPGGYVIIDDYPYWEGCKRAVDEFLDVQGLPHSILQDVSGEAAYFQKPLN